MFEQSILKGATKTRRAWTVLVSFAGQIVVVGLATLIPLAAVDHIPMAHLIGPIMAPPPPPAPPPPRTPDHVKIVDVVHYQGPRHLTMPTSIPNHVARIVENTEPPVELAQPCTGCVLNSIGQPGNEGSGVLHSIGEALNRVQPWQPRNEVAQPANQRVERPPERIKLGGVVMQGKLIRKVTPVYPPLAIPARIEGTVVLQAVIGRDGLIQQLAVVSGHPFLVQSAVNAVRQWVYQPTTLNGNPVEVLTTVEVTFKLSR